MPLLFSKHFGVVDLEQHINDLIIQKYNLQSIDKFTDNKLDFADMVETYNLLVEEIERLQKQLRQHQKEDERVTLLPERPGMTYERRIGSVSQTDRQSARKFLEGLQPVPIEGEEEAWCDKHD